MPDVFNLPLAARHGGELYSRQLGHYPIDTAGNRAFFVGRPWRPDPERRRRQLGVATSLQQTQQVLIANGLETADGSGREPLRSTCGQRRLHLRPATGLDATGEDDLQDQPYYGFGRYGSRQQ